MSHQVQIRCLEDIVVGLSSALESPLAKDLMVIMEDIDGGEGYCNTESLLRCMLTPKVVGL